MPFDTFGEDRAAERKRERARARVHTQIEGNVYLSVMTTFTVTSLKKPTFLAIERQGMNLQRKKVVTICFFLGALNLRAQV